ncbi:MAG: hypothetical protein O2960_29425 [Verrucomicrobia bacterium]|nr:hypothetical protein [Verrucomicrobiota bacterium]
MVVPDSVPLDTLGGRVHVEWDPHAPVTPMGQVVFFSQFLQTAGLFDPWVEECPLDYRSPNAPKVRDVLGTQFLSVLAGHHRYAHVYHSYFMGSARLALDVEVQPGKQTAALHSQPGLWRLVDELPKEARPWLVRARVGKGRKGICVCRVGAARGV